MNNTVILSCPGVGKTHGRGVATSQSSVLLDRLVQSCIIPYEDWQALAEEIRQTLARTPHVDALLPMLVDAELLTEYQAARILIGSTDQLMLGTYRILDRIGSGGMGIVYRGEHAILRRPVAIKVIHVSDDDNNIILQRFFIEMRSLASIHHPNIVAALDAGTVKNLNLPGQATHYLVMEYVAGRNLEDIVGKAPMSVAESCELAYQISSAIDETHKHDLIHRDIKPANILVTPTGVAKLLDFGLALHFGRRRLTLPGTLLGTLCYMAPEQVTDAANVDIRADLFSLGCTLYFCLTGHPPFAADGTMSHQVAARLMQTKPELRPYRADISHDLEIIVQRMMAYHRDDRYPTPRSVMRALLPYVNASMDFGTPLSIDVPVTFMATEFQLASGQCDSPRVLIVDDEPPVRDLIRHFLHKEGFECHEAGDGETCLRQVSQQGFDLILLDIDMPNLPGAETLKRLRQNTSTGNLKVIMMSGGATGDEMSELLALGADDFLTKPLNRSQMIARAKSALLHKAAQDRLDFLHQQLLQMNLELEQTLALRCSEMAHARNALIFTLAKIVESRSSETGGHLTRMTHYCSALAQSARRMPRFATSLDDAFLQTLETCSLLHDIGNVAMPDSILQSAHRLDPEDVIILQTHTTIGAETLQSVAKRDRSASAMWQMATDIAHHHHERFDGTGYPDHLAGNDIPLSARIVAVADTYDLMRVAHPAGMELSHNAAVEYLLEGSSGHLDPLLVQAFAFCAAEYEKIYQTHGQKACVA